MRRLLIAILVLALGGFGIVLVLGSGLFGDHEGSGEVTRKPRPLLTPQTPARGDKQILFGDLHVHTTLSTDAFLISLPLAQGEGAHPPADACDFARFCSALDFWSINDHAEGVTPRQWRETVESIRECNAVAGPGQTPDTVAFLGWEWTQVGVTPSDHYGHKNVVVKGLADDEVPARPIASRGMTANALRGPSIVDRGLLALANPQKRMQDFARFLAERAANEPCPEGVASPQLPGDCVESTTTPQELFRKLDEWESASRVESMVIPHGTTWGFYTPPGSSWDKQLSSAQQDEQRQYLIEIYSGHGNSEEYRDWRGVEFDSEGRAHCPAPRPEYLPACWRAGEIIRERCLAEGTPAAECDVREEEARQLAAEAGVAGHLTVSGESPDDWLDAGQCRDCFLPPMNHRPGSSVQYILALRNFAEPDGPERFRFGFIGSSDIHFARPGTGYKEVHRTGFTESRDMVRRTFLTPKPGPKLSHAVPFDRASTRLQGFQLVELERQSSFFLTGGLVAAHASGRTREDIWNALERKEVYATSGPRILLWFDLLNPPGETGPAPMGTSVALAEAPRFTARAVGSFEQQPGCPDYATQALSPERLAHVCKGECYYPSEKRRLITRIEVVRIRPRTSPDEDVRELIEDPWRTFACAPDPAGCEVAFEDADFPEAGRDAVYYVRAVEEPSLAVNASGVSKRRCGTPETVGDDCLAETEERAWSSPIYVDRAL